MLEVMEQPDRTTTIAAGTRAVGRTVAPARMPQGRSNMMDTMAAAIVHDLRNPLAAVCGCAEMLLDGNLDAEQTRRLTINIHRAAGRMRKLLTGFTGFARESREGAAACNLRTLIVASAEAAGASERNDVTVQLDVPARIEVYAAPNRLERVFANLIMNSLEAMREGGTIHIAAKYAGGCVLVEVEDDGPGIPAEIRDRLFEPFVTSGKPEGLGLGLALSRQTIRDHGGDLWVEPAPGARFVIFLPLRRTCS